MKTNNIATFPCSWSKGVTFLTAFTVITMVAFAAYFVGTDKLIWIKYTLITIILATIIGVLILMPLRLTIDNDKITLHRLIGAIDIPFKDITEIRPIQNSEIAYSIRLFGSGGLFGYLGKFKNKILGNYTMYATNLNELILIRTDRKTYVFSCKNRNKLIEYSQSNLIKGFQSDEK